MRCLKSVRTLILFTLLAACPAPAASDPDLPQRLDSLFEGSAHATFEWASVKDVSDRAAILVPVNLDGTVGTFQLDTGLDVTVVYGDIPADRGWETHDGMYHVPSFEIGGIDLGPMWLRSREESGRGEAIGSLGLDLLVGYWVLIDYPGRRLALMRPGEAPLWLWQRATWTPAELRDAKFFPYVILGGKGVGDLFFDTGSSAFDIVVDFDDWIDLTGHAGPDAAPVQRIVSSWGKRVTAVGAPATGPLIIGSARIVSPQVFYLKEQPNLFANWPFPAKGLVGNAPFWDRVLIMDLGLRPRFGLLQ
jgi:hypothetical protein